MFKELFDRDPQPKLIQAALRDFSSMLTRSAEMMTLACRSLLDNEPLNVDLDAMDDAVDEGERMIRRTVLEHLAIDPSRDLVVSLVLVSMVQEAERIGDFARGLGELLPLAGSPREGRFRDKLKQISQEIQPLFKTCEEAFRQDDPEKANEVTHKHTELKKRLVDLTAEIARSDLSADMAVVYTSAARILRRISAHLSNIASSVTQPFDRIRSDDELA